MKVAMSMQNTHFVCHDKSDRVSELLKFKDKISIIHNSPGAKGGGEASPPPGGQRFLMYLALYLIINCIFFWYFEIFISAKDVYRIYLAYLYFVFSTEKEFCHFHFFGNFLPILQIS